MSHIASILAKLDTKKKSVKKDWAAINEARKKAFWKPTQGKNEILVITPSFSEDPFTIWGYHKNLQEVDYYSIPCDNHNKGEACVVCEVHDALKSEDWEGNKYLWMPIEPKTETYIPVIDLTSAATKAEGPKWFRVAKSVLNSMIENMKNIEEGEVSFFDPSAPQRVIISYDKNQPPTAQYSVSFKAMKDIPTAEQYAEWGSMIQPVGEYIFSKTQDEAKKLVDGYFERQAALLEASANEAESAPAPETTSEAPAESKLSRLKGK